MKKLIYTDIPARYLDDVKELQRQLKDAGYEASLNSIYNAWNDISDGQCASWLCLSKDPAENVSDLVAVLTEVPEE